VGTDAIPPRADGLPARLVLGPALRAQSDRRLVRLVREGYEGAFDEIVRRYRRPLGRFAASIVGGRHEDVTQDSFRKALEALRRGDAEIELRPWLYRIVRNTALNDLRDRPPAAAELADDLVAGTRSAAAEAEAREDVAELVQHLRALPENQRAALLMRELDGMGHDEIGAALGISKGAARQAIARGRAAVRSGFGALLPLPWLRSLLDGGAPVEAGVGTGGLAGAGATAIGAGSAGALKIGLATVVVAGSLGAGVAIDHGGAGHHISQRRGPVAVDPARAAAPRRAFAVSRNHYGELRTHGGAAAQDVADDSGGDDRSRGRSGDSHDRRGGEDRRRDHGGDEDDRRGSAVGTDGSHSGEDRGRDDEDVDRSGGGPGPGSSGKDSSGDSGFHSGGGGGRDDGTSRDSSGHGGSGHGSGGGDDDSTKSGGGAQGSGSGPGGGSRSSGGGHGSSDDGGSTPVETPASPSVQESSSGGHGSTSSSSGGSGPSSESSDASSGSDDSVDAPASGSPGGESPTASTEPPAVVEGSSGSGGGGGSPGGPSNSGDSEIHP
jgi:RNA polymerase sigma factor (sigma-70 family)